MTFRAYTLYQMSFEKGYRPEMYRPEMSYIFLLLGTGIFHVLFKVYQNL